MKKLLWLTDNIQNSQSLIAQIGYTSHIYNIIDFTQKSLYISEMFSEDFCFIIHLTNREISDVFYENLSTLLEERSDTVQCIVITPIGNCFLPVKHRVSEALQMCYLYDKTKVIGYSYLLKDNEKCKLQEYDIRNSNVFFQPIYSDVLSKLIYASVNQECEHICIYAVSKESRTLQQKRNFLKSLFNKKKDVHFDNYYTPKRIESDLCEKIIQNSFSHTRISTPLSTEVK